MSLDFQSSYHKPKHPRAIPITLNLFETKQSPPRLEFLHVKQKRILEDNILKTMSNNSPPKLDLKLNLSPKSTSPPTSCMSTEAGSGPSGSPGSATSAAMVVVGCPSCLMYVMLSEDDDPKYCPKCKSNVLLDFVHHDNTTNYHNDNDNDNNDISGSSKKIRKN